MIVFSFHVPLVVIVTIGRGPGFKIPLSPYQKTFFHFEPFLMRPKSIAKDIEQLCSASTNFITRSSFFKDLCKYVFKICDSDGNGSLNATELYAGVLLVHLNLAKYAGPAACFPAPRDVVNQLFIASDYDNSGGIDQTEFEAIMVRNKTFFLDCVRIQISYFNQ
jgi:hypothetical protein